MSSVSSVIPRGVRHSSYVFGAVAAAALVAIGLAQPGILQMVGDWAGREEYSHALMIPFVAIYLVWQRRAAVLESGFRGSWFGITVVLAGIALQVIGGLAAVYVIQQYGFFVTIFGLILSLLGGRTARLIWAPLLMLLLMVPLPEFLLQNLSAQLRLISSQLGVWFIRLFDISVFVEGNVIDLGGYKLQVAEACDGLRYLFPLLTLSFIMAYMFRAVWWKRAVLFISAIPITILMNSFRIGTIGVLVEHWGTRMAEGFLHDFQGWAVFMLSGVLLFLEVLLFARFSRDRRPWREVFGFEAAPPASDASLRALRTPVSFVIATAALVVFGVALMLAPERTEATPAREPFVSFPMQLDAWNGARSGVEQIYLDALQLDDYLMANYSRGQSDVVNLYVAWYDSQRAGQSAHSPRSCLPGGGWRISDLRQISLPNMPSDLRVNRVEIELGTQRQLIYYWFQQRGRSITNEYLVKWYLFWDSLTRKRSDGALVRVGTPVLRGESIENAERRLTDFASQAAGRLGPYVPN